MLGIIFSFSVAESQYSGLLKTNNIHSNDVILNEKSEQGFLSKLLTDKTFTQISQNKGENDLDLSRFWEVYNIIRKESYDISDIEKEELIDGAITGLVSGLNDRHTEYMNTEQKEKFENMLSGDFEGIGAVVAKHPLGIEIERVIKGSPALKYGLKSKDIIIDANENKLIDFDLYDAIDKIKGPAGTKVVLKVLREGENEILTFDVIREKITIPSVDSEKLENNIGYISLNMFGDETYEEFEKVLRELQETDGLIIDLRDNGGGLLHIATEILSELIEHNSVLVTTKYKNGRPNEVYKSINYGQTYKEPIVVLINENSASASEIMAGALRDHEKAILVGKKSYGKGSVQRPVNVSNNSILKLTIAKWFTPDNKNIDKEGINPDIEIGFEEEDFENDYDRQLETAKTVLENYIQSKDIEKTLKDFPQVDERSEEYKKED
ncbi:MAG: S41 family peptidase [Candidatus Gracilibacteria bacterium]|nr:S41 family peptidase [Candidatus Gracilibacteria bacterium]